MTWLAQNLDPVVYGLSGWLAIAVGFCVLVALGVVGVWSIWITHQWRRRAFVRTRNGLRLRRDLSGWTRVSPKRECDYCRHSVMEHGPGGCGLCECKSEVDV